MPASITLKEFLSRYTAVPERFINEYIEFYDLCKINKFGISVEKIMKYLGITDRFKFEKRIRAYYTLNEDYQIIRLQQKLTKGVKDVYYMVSFDGFEKIVMKSNTKKGQEFRDYFIMLRKFIDYYRQHISDKIMELTKTNKFIYVLLTNKNKNIFKLGRTGNIRKRLQAYATGKDTHPDVKFIMIVNDSEKVESCSKVFLKAKQFKANKELYQENLEIIKKIIYNCAGMDKMMIDNINDNKKYDTYVIYDDSKTVEYLDVNNNVIGWEKGSVNVKIPKNTSTKKKTVEKVISTVNKTLKNAEITSTLS
jgi:phage anti-repressor protein